MAQHIRMAKSFLGAASARGQQFGQDFSRVNGSVQQHFPLVYNAILGSPDIFNQPNITIFNQECGVLERGLDMSICASVAKVLVGPPVKCLIFGAPINRINSSSHGCKDDYWEVKKRAQHLFAIETDYVRVRAFCFVHGSGAVTHDSYGGRGGTTAPPKDGRVRPPDPYFVAIPYPTPAYANDNVHKVVNALLMRPRQQSSTALIIGRLRGGDVEKEDMSRLRAALLAACQSEPSCELHQPIPSWQNAPSEIYATVDYCLMPPGDTATRAGWFHALSGLCVPVFFSSCLILPTLNRSLVYDSMYAPLLPFTHRVKFGVGVWSVVLDANRALKDGNYVFDALRAINAKAMRETIATFVHRLQRDNIRKYISERTSELY